jgi:hypothetical protein
MKNSQLFYVLTQFDEDYYCQQKKLIKIYGVDSLRNKDKNKLFNFLGSYIRPKKDGITYIMNYFDSKYVGTLVIPENAAQYYAIRVDIKGLASKKNWHIQRFIPIKVCTKDKSIKTQIKTDLISICSLFGQLYQVNVFKTSCKMINIDEKYIKIKDDNFSNSKLKLTVQVFGTKISKKEAYKKLVKEDNTYYVYYNTK